MSTAQDNNQAWDALQFTRGDRLAKALRYAGMTNAQMAEVIGVQRNTISNYTNDHTPIPKLALKEWAVRTGVPIEWLETGIFPDSTNPHPSDYTVADLAPVIPLRTRSSAGAVA